MADSDLQTLHNKLTAALTERVKVFSDDEPSEKDFVDLLGSVHAAKVVATQLVELDRRTASLSRASAKSNAPRIQAKLDELASKRTQLVDALVTLTREMQR